METSDFGANIFEDPNQGSGDKPAGGDKPPRKRPARKKKGGKRAAEDHPDAPAEPSATGADEGGGAVPAGTDSWRDDPAESAAEPIEPPAFGAVDSRPERRSRANPATVVDSDPETVTDASEPATEGDTDPRYPAGSSRGARKRRRRRSRNGEDSGTDRGQPQQGDDDSPADDAAEEPARDGFAASRANEEGDSARASDDESAADDSAEPADFNGDAEDRDGDRSGRRRRRRRRGRRGEFDREPGEDEDRSTTAQPAEAVLPVEGRRTSEVRPQSAPPRESRPYRDGGDARHHGRAAREDDDVRTGMPVRHPTRSPIDVPTADSDVHGSRLAILIDLEHVEEAANERGREVAWGRLVATLGRRRHVIRCLGYAEPARADAMATMLSGNGIEVVATDEHERAVHVAIDAVNLAARVDAVVMVPASSAFGPVARALRGRGIRVESAAFGASPSEPASWPHQTLGDECLFAP